MAKRGVIVRQLNAIENLGSMDTLCTDKTGTLTVGVVQLDGALDVKGDPSDEVMRYAYLNAAFQTGLANPLDEAILAQPHPDTTGMDKLEEIPYDFTRKRLSVVIDSDPGAEVRPLLITKGALDIIVTEANGVPRRLNVLCDNALITGFGYQKNPVTASIAREVVNDFAAKRRRPPVRKWKVAALVGVAVFLAWAFWNRQWPFPKPTPQV